MLMSVSFIINGGAILIVLPPQRLVSILFSNNLLNTVLAMLSSN